MTPTNRTTGNGNVETKTTLVDDARSLYAVVHGPGTDAIAYFDTGINPAEKAGWLRLAEALRGRTAICGCGDEIVGEGSATAGPWCVNCVTPDKRSTTLTDAYAGTSAPEDWGKRYMPGADAIMVLEAWHHARAARTSARTTKKA